MAELEEEFQNFLIDIQEGKANFSEDEQNIIDAWIDKLSQPKDTDEEKTLRNNYARNLVRVVKEDKELSPPFSDYPPGGDLMPLTEADKGPKYSFKLKKMPCANPRCGQRTGAIPKVRKPEKFQSKFDDRPHNMFENPEEMSKIIARSKGQSLADFVASISRHTSDYGQELRNAMNSELSNFKEYVDRILSQRIKDLTEVLDQEQNQELLRIKKDTERWQLELLHVKRRIKEIFPSFNLESYTRDKYYLKKAFTVETPVGRSKGEFFQSWKEETCVRLKWLLEMTCETKHCSNEVAREISQIKCNMADLEAKELMKQQNFMKQLNCDMNEYQKLKSERDQLHKETFQMQSQLRALGN